MNANTQDIPACTVCLYDRLADPTMKSAEYFVPDLGTLHIQYKGDYEMDKAENNLTADLFAPTVILCYGLPYVEIVFNGFEPAILPNPDKLLFGTANAQPVQELVSQLSRAAKALDDVRSIITRHFPIANREVTIDR